MPVSGLARLRNARAAVGSFVRRRPGVIAAGAGAIAGAVTTIAALNSSSVALSDPFKDSTLQFPNDLVGYGNYMTFRAFATNGLASDIFSSAIGAIGGSGFLGQLVGQNGATIRLPLPNNLRADYDPQYGSKDLGATPAAVGLKYADRQVYGTNGPGLSNAIAAAGISGMGTLAGKLMAGGRLAGFASAFSGGGDGVDQAAALKVGAGVAVTPHKILLFTGVDFRKHQFSWKLSPRNEKESRAIQEICKAFTYYAHPNYIAGGLFLKYPEFFEIGFAKNGYLYKFMPAVIESIAIDYQPMGYPAYKRGNLNQTEPAPAEVQISIQFQETEIITKEALQSTLATLTSTSGPMFGTRRQPPPGQVTSQAGSGNIPGPNVSVDTTFGSNNPPR